MSIWRCLPEIHRGAECFGPPAQLDLEWPQRCPALCSHTRRWLDLSKTRPKKSLPFKFSSFIWKDRVRSVRSRLRAAQGVAGSGARSGMCFPSVATVCGERWCKQGLFSARRHWHCYLFSGLAYVWIQSTLNKLVRPCPTQTVQQNSTATATAPRRAPWQRHQRTNPRTKFLSYDK